MSRVTALTDRLKSKPPLLEAFKFLGLIITPMLIAFLLISSSLTMQNTSNFEHFNVFWSGFLIALVGLTVYGFTSHKKVHYFVSTLTLGLLGTYHKIVLLSQGPLYHDEYAHLRTSEDIAGGVATGFNSIVNAVPLFDGMHRIVAFLANLFNADVWTTGASLIILIHIATPIIILWFTNVAGFSFKAGFFASLIYTSNSNWMYFHSQFAYESFALPLAIVVLGVILKTLKQWRWPSVETVGFTFLISGLMFILSHVHHLSTVFVLTISILFLIVNLVAKFMGQTHNIMGTGLVALGAAVGSTKNILDNASFVREYLLSPAGNGWAQLSELLMDVAFGSERSESARTLFEGGALPFYEVALSFVSVIIVGLIVLYGLTALFEKLREKIGHNMEFINKELAVLMAFGSLYVVSVFLVLTPGGAEGARRSWGYMFIGVALISAWMWDSHLFKMDKYQYIIALLVIPVLFVGSTAAGLNGSYRFPLSNVSEDNVVSDIDASSAEARALGEWFKNNTEPDTWVLTDRYSKLQVASTGKASVLPAYSNFPYWELYFHPDRIDDETFASIVASIYASGTEYMVVDTRMITHKPELGFWFARTESDDFKTDDEFYMTEAEFSAVEDLFFVKYETEIGPYVIYRIVFPEYVDDIAPDFPELIIEEPKDIFSFLEETSRSDFDLSDIQVKR